MKPLEIKTKAGAPPELFIYGEIGPDWTGMISGNSVQNALTKVPNAPKIIVRLNSGGGDVFEGIAIHNALTRHPARIEIEIDALAASAASYIAMAGGVIRMAENSMMMVHNSWSIVAGNKTDLAKTIEVLSRIDENLAAAYAARTGLPLSRIEKMLDVETWLTADEAIEYGFADSISATFAASAKVAAGRYRNTPKAFLDAAIEDRYQLARKRNAEILDRLDATDPARRRKSQIDNRHAAIRESLRKSSLASNN